MPSSINKEEEIRMAILEDLKLKLYRISKAKPKIKKGEWSTGQLYSSSTLGDYLSYYKTISLVRQCINLRSSFATSKGFFTEIETLGDEDPEEFVEVKKKVDEMNRKVNLDEVVYIAEIKREIFGYAGFEIVKAKKECVKLNPLQSVLLEPNLDEDWNLDYYIYDNNDENELKPEDIFFIGNDRLEGDPRGLSMIQPIVSAIKQKMELDEDVLAAAMRMWAPFVIAQVDTSMMTEAEEETKLIEIKNAIEPGVSLVTNKSIEFQVIHMTPDLQSLMLTRQNVDEEILGNFQVPKPLVGREKSLNRASLEYSLKALREVVITRIQRTLKREIERQLYDPIVQSMGLSDKVRIKHIWKPISIQDFVDMAVPVNALYSNKIIDRRIAYDLLDLDKMLMGTEASASLSGAPRKQKRLDEYKQISTRGGEDLEVSLK